MKTIYLAGFDVFRPDAIEFGDFQKELCRQLGFEGLHPLDNAVPETLSGPERAQWIYRSNIALIHRADCISANVNRFRGAEPDSGTVFEIGYAVALGKPVWVYTQEARSLVEQLAVARAIDGRLVDESDFTVEDFALNLNLMIACSTKVVIGSLEDCLQQMGQAYLQPAS